jgi:hypothetical protein
MKNLKADFNPHYSKPFESYEKNTVESSSLKNRLNIKLIENYIWCFSVIVKKIVLKNTQILVEMSSSLIEKVS